MNEIIRVKKLKIIWRTDCRTGSGFVSHAGDGFRAAWSERCGKKHHNRMYVRHKKPDAGTVSILGMNPFLQRKQLFEKSVFNFKEANYQDKVTVAELCEVTQSLYRNTADYGELLKQFDIADKAKKHGKGAFGRTAAKAVYCFSFDTAAKSCFSGRADDRA